MNLEELRIGNYLYVDVSKTAIEPVKIELSDLLHINYGYGNYEPIQITTEWLLLFGFNKMLNFKKIYGGESSLSWFKDNILFIGERKFNNDSNFSFCFQHNNFISQIKYVHQLQNLYFAVRQEELFLNQEI